MKAFFEIQQFCEQANQYEPIQNGEFDTAAAAIAAMDGLASDLGWVDMRVVERIETETTVKTVGVVAVQDDE